MRACYSYSHQYFALIIIICFLFIPVEAGSVEKLEIFGTQFDLNDLRFLDSNAVQVTLFSESRIIKRGELNSFVAEQYAAQGKLLEQIGQKQLHRFMIQAIKEDPAVALVILDSISKEREGGLSLDLETLAVEPGAKEVFKAFLLSTEQNQAPSLFVANIIIILARNESAWIRSQLLKLVYSHRSLIYSMFESGFLEDLKAQRLERAAASLQIEKQLFGSSDSHFQRLLIILEKLEQFKKRLSFDDGLDYINITRQFADDDPLIRGALEDSASVVLHQRAEQSITDKKLEQALRYLLAVDFHKRTPTTYKLLHLIVSKYPAVCSKVLDGSRALSTLLQLGKQDQSLWGQLADMLSQQVNSCLKSGDLERAGPLFDALLIVRPDPNSANDTLRLEYSGLLKEQGKESLGKLKEAEIQSRSILFKVILKDVFDKYSVPIVILLGVILIYLGYRLKEHTTAVKMGGRRSYSFDQGEGDVKIGADKRFVMSSALKRFDPRQREYESCLRFFSLPPNAGLDAIKLAYRNAVKSYHPDVNCDEQGLASQKFIEVTQIHDRIMELRKIMKKDL